MNLESLAADVRRAGQDTKWRELSELLTEIFTPAGLPGRVKEERPPYGSGPIPPHTASPRQKLVIFTEHRDTLAYLARQTRMGLIEELGADYVRTARAKGLAERTVLVKHALPNAALPILTLFGSMLPVLIGGSIVVESVFDLPGMGRYAFEGLLRRDYNIVMATTTVSALVTMAGLFMADVSYTLVDPRIRLD